MSGTEYDKGRNADPHETAERLPFFSVIMPTRNRPALFREALDSVLKQTFANLEVLVVNDGSNEEYLHDYHTMEQEYDSRVRWYYQPQRPNGHGQSYSMNSGAYMARGNYICFLDDDDTWFDNEHLQRVHEVLSSVRFNADVVYCNQVAFDSQGKEFSRGLWIADLEKKLRPDMRIADSAYLVSTDFMLTSAGFAHLNCTIIRKALYLEINGMDENIRYECDRDIYLRTIDAAEHILYSPSYVARHNVPDPGKKDNMSTLVSDLEKRLYQINVFEKAVLLAKRECIRAHSTLALSDIYKHMTTSLLNMGHVKAASQHASQALALRYSLKWHAYCLYLAARGFFAS